LTRIEAVAKLPDYYLRESYR